MTDHDTSPDTGHDTSHDDRVEKVARLMDGIRIAMLTTVDERGSLVSRPMATQDVEFGGDLWFIAERSSSAAAHIAARPQVNAAYSGSSSWVSLSGTARVVDDVQKLGELWDTFTGAWMEGGPENPENILIHIEAESAEYWDSPGSKVTQVLNLVKAKVTGDRFEADNETVDL